VGFSLPLKKVRNLVVFKQLAQCRYINGEASLNLWRIGSKKQYLGEQKE